MESKDDPTLLAAVLTMAERRVLGVLVEKAKTTPDVYPMSINSLMTGSNQKSNREPIMNLSDENVETTLQGLQPKGYVTPKEVQGEFPVYVSRIRNDPTVESGLALWVVADNLRKGAATNAVQIAEVLVERGWLPRHA